MVRKITEQDMKDFYELTSYATFSEYASNVGDRFNWMTEQSCFAQLYSMYVNARKKDNKRYRYLLTFTLDPKKPAFETSEEFYIVLEEYIKKLAFSAQYEAIHWAVVREYHKPPRDTVAHWHVSVISKKIIKNSFFKYYQRVYGNVDISTSRNPSEEFSLNYMAKENDINIII